MQDHASQRNVAYSWQVHMPGLSARAHGALGRSGSICTAAASAGRERTVYFADNCDCVALESLEITWGQGLPGYQIRERRYLLLEFELMLFAQNGLRLLEG